MEKERQREFDYREMLWRKKGRESLITDRCSGERKAERVWLQTDVVEKERQRESDYRQM